MSLFFPLSLIELGHFALLLAMLNAAWGVLLPAAGLWKKDDNLLRTAVASARMNLILVGLSFIILVYAFVMSDFSVALVVANSHTLKPILYKIAGSWGNHEGSLLLWTLILSLYGFALSCSHDHAFRKTAVAVQNGLTFLFLLLLVFTSNPFARVFPPPPNGNDLNPLLQDPALAFHPPLLYAGYVGYSLVFALAVAGLINGQIDKTWAKIIRPWAMIAWIALTGGLTLGSWWAYYELGWGGWWFWDPVENAALLPWLAGTALLHSVIVLEKRGHLPNWTLLLALLCFALSLLGTFLVRSGVITSVHSFASDPARGLFILGILGITLGSSLLLYAFKRPQSTDQEQLHLFSREGALVVNNLLLITGMVTVLVGTLYPLILDSLTGTLISVGPAYFALTFVPLMLPMLALMAVGPYIAWGESHLGMLWRRIEHFSLVTAFIAVALLWWKNDLSLWSLTCFAGGLWVVISALAYWWERAQGKITQIFPQTASTFAIVLGHLGLGIAILGMVGSSFWTSSSSAWLGANEKTTLGGYMVSFDKVEALKGPNYNSDRATLSLYKGKTVTATLQPEKRWYPVAEKDTTEVAIHPVGTGDVYVALGTEQPDQPGRWLVRLYHHPLVNLLWAGAFLMLCGGGCALYSYRQNVKQGSSS